MTAQLETKTITTADLKQAFAVPCDNHFIDAIHPETGRSLVNGQTLEEMRERYPAIEIVNIDDWCAAKGARQDSPVSWDEITEERYDDWLECLPPAFMQFGAVGAFMVGEPSDHHAVSGKARFQACIAKGGKHFASSRPMTVGEFKKHLQTLSA